MQQSREYHIVVLGSGGVGKSCLTAQFVRNVFIESYDPTIEDSYRKNINVDGRQVFLEILDTAGTEQFTAMRDLYMKTGQGFLLVFSITSMSSLRELSELREQLIHIKGDRNFPLVLVGNKCDLEVERAVSRSHAADVSRNWGSKPYYETSARRRTNVDEVFVDLCRQIIRKDMEQASRYVNAGPGGKNDRLNGYDRRENYDEYDKYDRYERKRQRRRQRDRRSRSSNRQCMIL